MHLFASITWNDMSWHCFTIQLLGLLFHFFSAWQAASGEHIWLQDGLLVGERSQYASDNLSHTSYNSWPMPTVTDGTGLIMFIREQLFLPSLLPYFVSLFTCLWLSFWAKCSTRMLCLSPQDRPSIIAACWRGMWWLNNYSLSSGKATTVDCDSPMCYKISRLINGGSASLRMFANVLKCICGWKKCVRMCLGVYVHVVILDHINFFFCGWKSSLCTCEAKWNLTTSQFLSKYREGETRKRDRQRLRESACLMQY